MKKRIAINLLAACAVLCTLGAIQINNSSDEIYSALRSKDQQKIDRQLEILSRSTTLTDKAYEGTLMMRKAGIIRGAGKKLKLFRVGKEKLETAISGNKNNAEFRFLRLMIQENAPGILGYNDEIEEDALAVKKQFPNFPDVIKKAVLSYQQESKALKESKLR